LGQQPQPPPVPGQKPAAAGADAGFNLLSPGEAAQMLGVSEGDILSSITAGDLKAKKIGSTFRISRAALEEFLK
jgi:excisionase family DNA binding protein